MIKIESITIKEMRGIRDLTLDLGRESFVISGPNGSGKSGVVDAIQFALTGEMSRLKGSGTADITLTDHGPHVDKRDDPAAASVTLNVYIPALDKKASITRTIKKPKAPKITPKDPAVEAVFDELAVHTEVTLSRREIIKFILTKASDRSREVQTLLKLEGIDETRGMLKTTENKLASEETRAKQNADAAEDGLKRHLDLPALRPEDILAAINKRRSLLELPVLVELSGDVDVSQGLAEGQASAEGAQNKESALADVVAARKLIEAGFDTPTQAVVGQLLTDYASIDADPDLLGKIKRQPFVQAGLDFVDGPHCPLCDAEWDVEALRAHLQDKLKKSKDAQVTRDRIVAAGAAISGEAIRMREPFALVARLPEAAGEFAGQLQQWLGGVSTFGQSLRSFEGVLAARERIEAGWAQPPENLAERVAELQAKVEARPDKGATEAARSFLVIAQERMTVLRRAKRELEEKKADAARGRAAYKTYCDVSEKALTSLYEQVEEEFASFYRLINYDDEGEFKAKLEPAEGKLDLKVDFHKKGMFPPGAYHSEGHQDGMGVCLYLALMKHVLGDSFTFAVLDDVVMSVDALHRKQFCKLLKTHFPNTQFIITTHDQVWARQIRSEALVASKAAVSFHHWTVETGPILDEVAEVWDQIKADLAKSDVPTAAARLRRHLEYVSADLAHELGAKVKFRADGGYDMGELLSAVIARHGELLKLATKAAKSWGDDEQAKTVEDLQTTRNTILAAKSAEEWVLNKLVHYNEWADMSRNDFQPSVDAFKDLLDQFRCANPKCGTWLHVTPRQNPEDLRCGCGKLRLNLKEK